MAPITGSVLIKIFDFIADYPLKHPRYQPFQVIEKETDSIIIKTSDSEDFVWNVFRKLAEMFVNIEPIILPHRHGIRLYVEDAKRDIERYSSHMLVEDNDMSSENSDSSDLNTGGNSVRGKLVAHAAAEFYENLYTCINSIKSGDYSLYEPAIDDDTDNIETAVSTAPSKSPTTRNSHIYGVTNSSNSHVEASNQDNIIGDEDESDFDNKSTKDSGIKSNLTYHGNEDNLNKKHKHYKTHNRKNHTGDENLTRFLSHEVKRHILSIIGIESDPKEVLFKNLTQAINGTKTSDFQTGDEEVLSPSYAPSYTNETVQEVVEQEHTIIAEVGANTEVKDAIEEAEKLAEAAKEAASSPEDDKAAEAAAAATDLAKIAIQATTEAAAASAMANLLSGDGTLVTSVISTCFSNPIYKIRKDASISRGAAYYTDTSNEITQNTFAYLYIDGTHYYQLNLTAPYLDSFAKFQPIPKPQIIPEGRGDIIDWSLATSIIVVFFLGIVVMLHHVKAINFHKKLGCHSFFHPSQDNDIIIEDPKSIESDVSAILNSSWDEFDEGDLINDPNEYKSSGKMLLHNGHSPRTNYGELELQALTGD